MRTMQKAGCSRRSPTRALRRVTLLALATAIVVSFGHIATVQARCKPVPASVSAESAPSLDTTLTRLQQSYDCSRSLQANFDETLSSPGGMTRTRKGTVYFR